jgi:hypothetical protein
MLPAHEEILSIKLVTNNKYARQVRSCAAGLIASKAIIIHVNASDFDSWNISTSLYSTVGIWIPLWPDYWSRSICKTSTDKLYTCSHSVTLLSISEKSVRKASSLRISPREMFAYISITIHYDRSSCKFERPATKLLHTLQQARVAFGLTNFA